METNKSCWRVEEKRDELVIKLFMGFLFSYQNELFTTFSCFQCLSVWSIKYDFPFRFFFFSTSQRDFSITTRNSFLSSEFKSVINYIDASVRRNERFLWFDVSEAFSVCSAFGVDFERVHQHSWCGLSGHWDENENSSVAKQKLS